MSKVFVGPGILGRCLVLLLEAVPGLLLLLLQHHCGLKS